MKEKIIGILYAKTKRAEMLDSGHYAEVIEEDDFEMIAESIVKLCNLHIVNNNEADLDCDYDITAKVPFKSKKRYKMKVISEVAVCPRCNHETKGHVTNKVRYWDCENCGISGQTDC